MGFMHVCAHSTNACIQNELHARNVLVEHFAKVNNPDEWIILPPEVLGIDMGFLHIPSRSIVAHELKCCKAVQLDNQLPWFSKHYLCCQTIKADEIKKLRLRTAVAGQEYPAEGLEELNKLTSSAFLNLPVSFKTKSKKKSCTNVNDIVIAAKLEIQKLYPQILSTFKNFNIMLGSYVLVCNRSVHEQVELQSKKTANRKITVKLKMRGQKASGKKTCPRACG